MELPEFRDPNAGRLDVVSAALSLLAVLAAIYGIKQIAEDGLAWPPALAITVGLTMAALFVHRQQRLDDPLIDLKLFRSRALSASLAVNVLGFFMAFGTFLFIAQYLQLVLGMGPLEAGLWTAPSAGGFIVGSQLAPLLVRRVRPHRQRPAECRAAAGRCWLGMRLGKTRASVPLKSPERRSARPGGHI